MLGYFREGVAAVAHAFHLFGVLPCWEAMLFNVRFLPALRNCLHERLGVLFGVCRTWHTPYGISHVHVPAPVKIFFTMYKGIQMGADVKPRSSN